jgi:hypothetical protein
MNAPRWVPSELALTARKTLRGHSSEVAGALP